jgi:hypothetical protein
VTPLLPFPTDEAIPNDQYNMWVCGSLNKNQNVMNSVLDALNPVNVSRVAGSGNKIIYLLD